MWNSGGRRCSGSSGSNFFFDVVASHLRGGVVGGNVALKESRHICPVVVGKSYPPSRAYAETPVVLSDREPCDSPAHIDLPGSQSKLG